MIKLILMNVSIDKILQHAEDAIKLGEFKEAEANFKKALILKPDTAEIYYNLATIQQALNSLDDAEANFKKAIRLKPNFAKAHSNLGAVLNKLTKYNDAILCFQKAIKLKPNYALAYNNLGATFHKIVKFDDAETYLKKAIELKPDYADAYLNIGNTQKELGKLEEAEISTKKAMSLDSKNITAYSNLSLILKELGRLEEAKVNCIKAIGLKNDDAKSHYILGSLLYEQKHYKKAAKHFTLSDYSMSKSYLLRCLFKNDDQSTFYNELDRLIKNGENNAVIGSLISQSEIKYGVSRVNPFCKNPLNYILKTDLIKKNYFNKAFNQNIIDILSDNKIKKKTTQKLLNNGVQTVGNIFGQKNDVINEIKKIIYLEIEAYRSHFKNSNEGFLKEWPNNHDLIGWLVSMKNGGNIKPHMHEYGWISGSIYINVPPKVKMESGNLVVCIESDEHKINQNNKFKKSIDVVTGSFCLFPSSLHHYTVPFESEEDRIVLAFDIIPK